jgi:hypothetical protein
MQEEVPKVVEARTSESQRIIENDEALPIDEQLLLTDIIRHRVIEQRRSDLAAEVAEARQAYEAGDVRRGTVAEARQAYEAGDVRRGTVDDLLRERDL